MPIDYTTQTTPMAPLAHSVIGPTVDGGPSALPAPEDHPPLLIGGLIQQKPLQNANTNLSGIGHDWLTVSVSKQVADDLVALTDLDEPGSQMPGFARSERRICMAGSCTRRFDPHTRSKRWGLDYESWVYSGATARYAMDSLIRKDCKPTRIDIAFDFDVHPDTLPEDIELLIVQACEDRGLGLHHSGPRKGYTLYVGSRTSERMIRVYRRDLKDPLLALEGASILRVELELKGALCLAYWRDMAQSGSTGFEVASMHILDMIGYSPWDQLKHLPDVRRVDDETDATQMVFQFVRQNAVMIEACSLYGLDIQAMARLRLLDASRMQDCRLRKKLAVMSGMPAERLQAAAEYWLNKEAFKRS